MACAAPSLLRVLVTGVRHDPPWIALGRSDTAQIINATRSIFSQGTIVPVGGGYPHGYAYQSTIAAIAHVTGLSVERADLAVAPFFALGLALSPLILFRKLTGSIWLDSYIATSICSD